MNSDLALASAKNETLVLALVVVRDGVRRADGIVDVGARRRIAPERIRSRVDADAEIIANHSHARIDN